MSIRERPLTENEKAGYDSRKKLTRLRDQAILIAYNKEYAKGLRHDIIAAKLGKEFYLAPKTIYKVLLRV